MKVELNDKQLAWVAEGNVGTEKLRWGYSRGTWNFIYSLAPFMLFAIGAVLFPEMPVNIKGYSLAVAGTLAAGISIRGALRMRNLVKVEFTRLKEKR